MRRFFVLIGLLAALATSVVRAQNDVRLYVDPAQPWAGFMNVFALPADGGGYQFGGAWGASDLRARFGNGVLTLQPNTNVSNPTDAYWVKADGSGNKQMEANWYVDSAALVGKNITFAGNSVESTLPTNYTERAFIKLFNNDYSAVLQQAYAPITNGNQYFTVTLNANAAGGAHVQYGFVTVGPNAPIGDNPAANSFITIRTNTADSTNLLVNPSFEQSLTGWTAYGNGGFTETQANAYYNNGNAGGSNVLVWEGTRVQKVFGQFSGGANYNGVFQDLPAGAGSTWSATAKFLTHAQDQIGAGNQAWLEVTFRSADNNVLATYKSLTIDNSSPTNTWFDMNVTNDEGGLILTAPFGTSKVRVQEVYYQPQFGGGSVYADVFKLYNLTASDPNLTSVPTNITRVVGETATFRVVATGQSALSYQWAKDGVPLSDAGNISGATTATLTITNVQQLDAGLYTVTVSDTAGSLDASATLTVKTPEEAVNLIENPSFETAAFPPWNKFNGGGVIMPASGVGKLGNLVAQAFNGGEYNGAFQDIPAAPGQAFAADGWFFVPSTAPLVNSQGWLELQFRAGDTVLALYKSSEINSEFPQDTWAQLAATNGYAGDFVTRTTNAVTPVAPPGTTTVRYQVTFHSTGSGSLYYDAMSLRRPPAVQIAFNQAPGFVNFSFPNVPATTYEIVYKDNLNSSDWTVADSLMGDPSGISVKVARYATTNSTARFFMVRAR